MSRKKAKVPIEERALALLTIVRARKALGPSYRKRTSGRSAAQRKADDELVRRAEALVRRMKETPNWRATEVYSVGMRAHHQGKTWVAMYASIGAQPSTNQHIWRLMPVSARKGETV